MNLVSVIIPYFKKGKFINRAIKSVLSQTYNNFEIIIIYDDQNLEELNKILKIKKIDNRIKVFVNKKNLGAGKSRNIGIKKSKGNLIAFLDADDYWKKNKLEMQIKFMNKYSANFVHSSYFIIDKFNTIRGYRSAPTIINYTDLKRSCDIGLSTVLLKKHIIKRLTFPNLKTKEDYVMWLKISKNKNKIYGMEEKLVYWRSLDNSLSSNFTQKLIDGYTVYRKYLKMNFLDSLLSLFVLSLNFLKKKYR